MPSFRRHAIRTTKLLGAVALVSAPACSQPTVAADRPTASATPAASNPPPNLPTLQQELATAGRDKALAAAAHYRPLCDADGYPLVGNLTRKMPDYQVSAFCAEVRKAR